MNLLENYIVEIHSVTPYIAEWTEEFNRDFVEVDITTDCYGIKKREICVFDSISWGEIKEQGYYMG